MSNHAVSEEKKPNEHLNVIFKSICSSIIMWFQHDCMQFYSKQHRIMRNHMN